MPLGFSVTTLIMSFAIHVSVLCNSSGMPFLALIHVDCLLQSITIEVL